MSSKSKWRRTCPPPNRSEGGLCSVWWGNPFHNIFKEGIRPWRFRLQFDLVNWSGWCLKKSQTRGLHASFFPFLIRSTAPREFVSSWGRAKVLEMESIASCSFVSGQIEIISSLSSVWYLLWAPSHAFYMICLHTSFQPRTLNNVHQTLCLSKPRSKAVHIHIWYRIIIDDIERQEGSSCR